MANDKLTQSQLERLRHIDYRLSFFGSLSRSDIQREFNIQGAAATRDIRLYKDLYPDNMHYCSQSRLYLVGDKYVSHLDLDYHDILNRLAANSLASPLNDGVGIAIQLNELSLQQIPSLDTFALLARAIHTKTMVTISYISLSSGLKARDIAPLALVNNGTRWHLRAFDRLRNAYSDFVVNRIQTLTESKEAIPTNQSLANDIQWNRFVNMKIAPHPSLKHPEAIELEYNMIDGCFQVNVRAALAGYFLCLLRVDSSANHRLDPAEHHLWLSNTVTLYDVENLAIAPGYQES